MPNPVEISIPNRSNGLNLVPLSSTQAVEASHEIFLVDAALQYFLPSDCNTFSNAKLLDVTWYRCRSTVRSPNLQLQAKQVRQSHPACWFTSSQSNIRSIS